MIKVITKLPNSEQSYKGKVKTHNYINRQNSLNIHFKQIICIFSSKKKNVELNFMFISQGNNIGNSDFGIRYLSYTAYFISSRGCREKQ